MLIFYPIHLLVLKTGATGRNPYTLHSALLVLLAGARGNRQHALNSSLQ